MYMQNLQYLLLIIVICVGTAEITVGPQNTAVKKGENVTLECWVKITEENEVVVWNQYQFREVWTNYDPYVTKVFQDQPLFIKEGYGNLTDIYPSLRRYRLIIQNASRNHAGKYACVLEKENTTQEAELMVVDPLRCTPGLSEIEIDVGQTVAVVCGIRSFGKYSSRLYVWTADRQNFSTTQIPPDTYSSAQAHVTATAALDGQANVCTVSFDYLADDNLRFEKQEFVGNVPRYHDECRTVMRVNKHVYMQILHNWEVKTWGVMEVELGDTISCVATQLSMSRNISNVWFTNDNNTDVIDGEEMTIEERHFGMHTYSCQVQFADDEIVHKKFTFYLPAEWPTNMQILRNMHVVKNVFDVEIGDNVTCTARGRPEPKFSISNNYNKTDVIDGSVMTIEERHVARSQTSYTCNAQITDGEKINKNSKSFWINGRRERGIFTIRHSAGYQDVSSALSIIIVALFTLLLQH